LTNDDLYQIPAVSATAMHNALYSTLTNHKFLFGVSTEMLNRYTRGNRTLSSKNTQRTCSIVFSQGVSNTQATCGLKEHVLPVMRFGNFRIFSM